MSRRWQLLLAAIAGCWLGVGAAHGLPAGSLADAARARGFHVGAAIDYNLSAARLDLAAQEFTSATPENSLKWGPLAPSSGSYDFSNADAAVEWAEQSGLRIRGHTLFWDRLNGMPDWVEPEVNAAPDPAVHLTQLMQTHAQTVVGRYAGRIAQWDVVNEPLALVSANPDPFSFFYEILGEEYLDIAFHAAHAADPNALLFLNETGVEDWPAKFPGLITIVEGMLARGVPIHGVGLQGHFLFFPPDPVVLRGQIEQLAALGVRVELTEVDIREPLFAGSPDPEAAQAQAYADAIGACLAVAACGGFTTWGIDDADTWLDAFSITEADAPNRPLLFDEALAPKRAYDEVVAVILAPAPSGILPPALCAGVLLARAAGRRRRCRGLP